MYHLPIVRKRASGIASRRLNLLLVIPAEAGIQLSGKLGEDWIPA
jgi:hypothetical protein